MAIIKFINRKNKTLVGLQRNIDYILDLDKTREDLIYGKNCDYKNAYQDMCLTKYVYGKNEGRQHIHFTQSFLGNELSYALAQKIGQKLLEMNIFDGFQVVMATHTDAKNVHNHFVINTVNANTGEKWKLSKEELQEIKDYSDELCAENGLAVIDENYKTTREYTSLKRERPRQEEMYKLILQASHQAKSIEELKEMIKSEGKELLWGVEKDYSKSVRLEQIISTCKYHAKDAKEFIDDLEYYGVECKWNVKAIFEDINTGEKLEEEFSDIEEYEESIMEMKEEKRVIHYSDDIRFFYEGRQYTPAHFLKNLRYEGKTLREQFEVNFVKNEDKPLPKQLMKIGNSDDYKLLYRSIQVARQCSMSKEDFMDNMKKLGYGVNWEDTRMYITFLIKDKKGKEQKIRNNKFYPKSSFTKEAFEEIFTFNRKMMKIICTKGILSVDQLREFVKLGEHEDLRADEKTGRIYLRHSFKGKNQQKQEIITEKECYFDEVALQRFFSDLTSGKIVMPDANKIMDLEEIKKEKKIAVVEDEKGYLFSLTSLSKRFSMENLDQRFCNNKFKEKRKEVVSDIRSILYCSSTMEDFQTKLELAGYRMEKRKLTKDDKGKIAMKEQMNIGKEECLIFYDRENDGFLSTFGSKGLSEENILLLLQKNQERIMDWEKEKNFQGFLRGIWAFKEDDFEAEQINRANIHSKVEDWIGKRDKRKEKGYER